LNIILCPRGVLAPPLDSCLSLWESRIRRERRFDSISRFKRRKKTENRDGYWAVARVQMPTQAHTLNFIFSFYLSPQPNRLLIIPKKKRKKKKNNNVCTARHRLGSQCQTQNARTVARHWLLFGRNESKFIYKMTHY